MGHARAGCRQRDRRLRVGLDAAQDAEQVAHLEPEHEIGVGHELGLLSGEVERVPRREVERDLPVLALGVDDREREELGQLDECVEGALAASDEVGDDDGPLGLEQPVRDSIDRVVLGGRWRVRREPLEVRLDELRRPLLLLVLDVEADVHGRSRLGRRQPKPLHERLRNCGQRAGLIVPLDVVAHLLTLHVRGVHPVDPRTPLRRVHRAGSAEQQHRNPVAPGVVDRHRGVLEADDVVQRRRHRPARRLRVAVGERDRDLLVQALDDLRAADVDERVVQAAERRARGEGDVLDAEPLEQQRDEIGAVLPPDHG